MDRIDREEMLRYYAPRQRAARSELAKRPEQELLILDYLYDETPTDMMLSLSIDACRKERHRLPLYICIAAHRCVGEQTYQGIPVYPSASLKTHAVQCVLYVEKVVRSEWYEAF